MEHTEKGNHNRYEKSLVQPKSNTSCRPESYNYSKVIDGPGKYLLCATRIAFKHKHVVEQNTICWETL